MDDSVLPSKLLSNLSLAADTIRRHNFVHLYSHFDTDGLTAAAIAAKALIREGKEFQITIFPTLSDEQMEIIESTKNECILVTDLGASYIARFDEMECDVVVLDHHTIMDQAKRICYANPHLYGVDGASGGCGASMALLFAITLNENNWDLSPLAITGMVGDMQHIKGMSGLNRYIVDEATKKGFVEIRAGSFIPVGTLGPELYMCTKPFIKGISGDADGTEKLLKGIGLNPNQDSNSLTEEQALKLSSLLALKLIEQGVTKDKMEEAVSPRYYFPSWGTDAETLSSVINACGRQEQAGIGIAVGLGDGQALEEAKRIDSEARKLVMEGILSSLDKVQEMKNIQWFDSSESGFTGMICSILVSYVGNPNKPVIGVNCAEEKAKVSSRGTHPLIEKGLDLSVVMRQACAANGGSGGGHNIASGGSILSCNRDKFLEMVDLIVGEQLKNA